MSLPTQIVRLSCQRPKKHSLWDRAGCKSSYWPRLTFPEIRGHECAVRFLEVYEKRRHGKIDRIRRAVLHVFQVCSICNKQGKRWPYARAHTHRHARTLPNTEALDPDIEEGAVNRRPLQALFPLPRGGSGSSAGPGAILLQLQIT